jgi:hypothetical protein
MSSSVLKIYVAKTVKKPERGVDLPD